MTITEFLEARIAEDESEAREYQGYEQDVWEAAGWFDCTRVLAECAVKRAILDEYTGSPSTFQILAHMASIYKDHPDYQQEWAA